MNTEKPIIIRPFTLYVLNKMDDMDARHTQVGEAGIMAQLSDEGRASMAAMTSINCKDHPKMTVYNSTAFVYRGMREMQLQLGNAK